MHPGICLRFAQGREAFLELSHQRVHRGPRQPREGGTLLLVISVLLTSSINSRNKQMRRDTQLNTRVVVAHFDKVARCWRVSSADGGRWTARSSSWPPGFCRRRTCRRSSIERFAERVSRRRTDR